MRADNAFRAGAVFPTVLRQQDAPDHEGDGGKPLRAERLVEQLPGPQRGEGDGQGRDERNGRGVNAGGGKADQSLAADLAEAGQHQHDHPVANGGDQQGLIAKQDDQQEHGRGTAGGPRHGAQGRQARTQPVQHHEVAAMAHAGQHTGNGAEDRPAAELQIASLEQDQARQRDGKARCEPSDRPSGPHDPLEDDDIERREMQQKGRARHGGQRQRPVPKRQEAGEQDPGPDQVCPLGPHRPWLDPMRRRREGVAAPLQGYEEQRRERDPPKRDRGGREVARPNQNAGTGHASHAGKQRWKCGPMRAVHGRAPGNRRIQLGQPKGSGAIMPAAAFGAARRPV